MEMARHMRIPACFFGACILALLIILYFMPKMLRESSGQSIEERSSLQPSLSITDLTHPSKPSLDQQSGSATWWDRRTAAQSQSRSKNVLLFTHMRGGNFILQHVFRHHFFWYEPLSAFYGSVYGSGYWQLVRNVLYSSNATKREIRDWEREMLADYVHNMLHCNMSHLPVEALTHGDTFWGSSFTGLRNCLGSKAKSLHCKNAISSECGGKLQRAADNNCAYRMAQINREQQLAWTHIQPGRSSDKPLPEPDPAEPDFQKHAACMLDHKHALQKCLPPLETSCSAQPIHVVKVHRLSMEPMRQILERSPEIHVIYYVRDPRAMARSRVKAKMTVGGTGDIVRECRELCGKMRLDIAVYEQLKQDYRKALLLVRYEDYVRDPKGILDKMYGHIGETPTDNLYKELYDMMHDTTSGRSFTKHPDKPELSVLRWALTLSDDQVKEMTESCRDVLTYLNYPVNVTMIKETLKQV